MMRLRSLLLATTALMPFFGVPAFAGPEGASVVNGSVSVQNPGTANVTVNQFSDKAIVNWHTFNIGANERTQFVQPNSSSVILNRVTGGLGPSEILGRLDANGRVFVVNRDGFIFGAGAVVSTAGFLATTSDIKNDDFMAGRYNFSIPGRADASIVNMGTITATNGGFAGLVAPGVRNSGTITANLGTVVLGAGNIFTLDFYGDKLITLGVNDQIAGTVKDVATGQTLKSLITNEGKLKANGGRVELTAAAARQVVDSVINTSGVIEANSVGTKNGQIILAAATASTKGNGLPTQTVKISGKLSAAGRKAGTMGGTILVTGEDIQVTGATIDASGRDGGGKVMIGGDWGGGNPNTALLQNQSAKLEGYAISNATTVSVDAATRIDASAKDRGDGGKVVLWSDQTTSFAGTILALGGKEIGNGGFAEVSGKGLLNYTGITDLRATNGSFGTLLLDPYDITISSSPDSNMSSGSPFTPSGSLSNLNVTTLENALAMASVVVTTGGNGSPGSDAGNITVSSGFSWSGSSNLTLSAYNQIYFSIGTIVHTGSGNLILRADNGGNGGAGRSVAAYMGQVNFSGSTGTVSVYYNPSSYTSPTNFPFISTASPSQLKSYMLVNNLADFQNIAASAFTLNQTYALGKNGNATGFTGFAPGTTFTGVLTGDGGLGTISTISNLSTSLFPFIGAGGIVRDLNLANVNIAATANNQFLGAVAGQNSGTIKNVSVLSGTISAGNLNGIQAGGLVGQNASTGSITGSNAFSTISVGSSTTSTQENNVGGLAGVNQGSITNSFAYGDITGGAHSNIGGLVGRNENGATILGSFAGAVLTVPDTTGVTAGGLVGFNFGSIDSSYAYLAGTVTGGSSSNVNTAGNFGGFVGINDAAGTITNSFAYAAVSVGSNNAVGGFVGSNNGTIGNSGAYGFVQGGDNAAGGFAGFNASSGTITNSSAWGSVAGSGTVGGFVGGNDGHISGSYSGIAYAYSDVATMSGGTAGGFAGENTGMITNSQAFSNVTGPNNTILGGFAGTNSGHIDSSSASGTVTSTGSNSVVGGLVGASDGLISLSSSSGPVAGTSSSYLGGLVGFNVGAIIDSTSSSSVTGGGASNLAGGLVGANFGSIDPSTSSGNVSSGPNSIVGGFVGANGAILFPNGSQYVGTISPDSGASGTASAGPGSTTGSQVGYQYPTSSSQLPSPPGDACNNSGGTFCGGTLFNPNGSGQDQFNNTSVTSPQLVVAANLVTDPTGPKTDGDPTPNTTPINNPPPGPSGGQGGGQNGGRPSGNQVPPPGLGPLPSGMPPLNETRFLSNEVVMQLGTTMTPEAIAALARSLGLEIITQQNFEVLGRTVFRFRIAGHLSVRDVIKALEANRVNVSAQPSYTYALTQDVAQADVAQADLAQADLAGAPADKNRKGDSAQYIVDKLHLVEAHTIATGKDVKVAVIDSEIDANHPDLQGVITATYDALPSSDQTPHPHGTGMAGAIASHRRLLGVAPGAKLLAVRAFGIDEKGAQGTSMNIVKGLEWAVAQGAKIINMSFAGPRDPILQQAIKKLSDDGIILIAAAGNAGPKSPPLFPGADANVIAVSATDIDDKVYKNANRGKYIAIAAPGVDILVPAPDGGYQLTTGTSVAAAHISGVVALLKEHNPQLKSADVRNILSASAKNIGPVKTDIGAGLVDPVQALAKGGPKSAEAR